jgi:hypothetical protein
MDLAAIPKSRDREQDTTPPAQRDGEISSIDGTSFQLHKTRRRNELMDSALECRNVNE